MQTFVKVLPLQTGKLSTLKNFINEFFVENKEKYFDMLNRYGLKGTSVHYQKLGTEEFIIVTHPVDNLEAVLAKLSMFNNSTNPFDKWFAKLMQEVYNFKYLEQTGKSEELLNFSL